MRLCIDCRAQTARGPRCPDCTALARRRYDQGRPATHSLYGTAAWRSLSADVRASSDRCHWCGTPTRSLVADHVIPLTVRPDLGLERSNLVPACPSCNVRRSHR